MLNLSEEAKTGPIQKLLPLTSQHCVTFQKNTWSSETVIKVPNKKVEGWALPEMPGQIYFSCPVLYLGRHAILTYAEPLHDH